MKSILSINLAAGTGCKFLNFDTPGSGPGPPDAKSARSPGFSQFPMMSCDGSDGSFGEERWLPLAAINGVPQLAGKLRQDITETRGLFIHRIDNTVNLFEEAGQLVSGMSVHTRMSTFIRIRMF